MTKLIKNKLARTVLALGLGAGALAANAGAANAFCNGPVVNAGQTSQCSEAGRTAQSSLSSTTLSIKGTSAPAYGTQFYARGYDKLGKPTTCRVLSADGSSQSTTCSSTVVKHQAGITAI